MEVPLLAQQPDVLLLDNMAGFHFDTMIFM